MQFDLEVVTTSAHKYGICWGNTIFWIKNIIKKKKFVVANIVYLMFLRKTSLIPSIKHIYDSAIYQWITTNIYIYNGWTRRKVFLFGFF